MNKISRIEEQYKLSLYYVNTQPYSSLQIQNYIQPHWVISHVLEGEVTMESNGVSFRVSPGDIMIHPPHVPFSEFSDINGVHQYMYLDYFNSSNIGFFHYYPVYPVISLSDPKRYARYFEELEECWTSSRLMDREYKVFSLTSLIISEIIESWREQGSLKRPMELNTTNDRFVKVITYMNEHLDRKISNDELAAIVHLNTNYFIRIFQEAHSISPMKMLKNIRIKKAKQLLEDTEETLEQIAQQIGLSDAAYFTRVFKKETGITPGMYRESVKSTKEGYILPSLNYSD